MRKVMALALLVVLLVSLVPMQVQAAYENTYTNTGNQRADLIGVALTQVGYQEGPGNGVWGNQTKYGEWAGHPNTEWCGWFVSWCARQAGIPTSVLQTCGRASPSGFGISSYFSSSQRTPQPGDLFFKKNFGHVGIVYYVDGNYFYTLEGNTSTSGWEGTSVMSRRRALNEFYFASPAYTSDSGSSAPSGHTHSYQKNYESSHPHKGYNKCSCGDSYYTGDTRTVSGCSQCSQSGGNTSSTTPTQCSHSYGKWSSTGSTNHRKTCSKCGDRVTKAHSWQDEDITKPPTCQEEGEKTQRCSDCGAKRTQSVDKLDEHIYMDWIVSDEENHVRKCEYCDDVQLAPHALKADEQGRPNWQSDDVGHWYECADCGKRSQEAIHTAVTGLDATKHWQYCRVCEKILVDAEEHQFGSDVCRDEQTHWYACTQCGAKKDQAEHTYELIQWEEGLLVESCQLCQQLSGNVVQENQNQLVATVTDNLTILGRMIVPEEVVPEEEQPKWHLIAGAAAVGLAVILLVVGLILIIRAIRKRKKKKV